jgi:tetratricopeptide (TPR) repeat protein
MDGGHPPIKYPELAAAFERDPGAMRAFFAAKVDGEAALSEGRYDRALKSLSAAQAVLDKLNLPDNAYHQNILTSMGVTLLRSGKTNEAERCYRKALVIAEATLVDDLDKMNLGSLKNNIGRVFQAQGKLKAAEESLREAVALGEEVVTGGALNEPGEIYNAKFSLAGSYHNLADVLAAAGAIDESVRLFRKCLEIRRAIVPHGHQHLTQVLNNLGIVLKNARRFAEAEPLFREILSFEGSLSDPPALAAGYHAILAECLLSQKKGLVESLGLFKKALSIQQGFLPAHHRDLLVTKQNIRNVQALINMGAASSEQGSNAMVAVDGPRTESGISEELRAKMIAELIDEDKNDTSKKKKKGKK